MMRTVYCLIAVMLWTSSPLLGDDAAAKVRAGVRQFQDGRFEEAAESFTAAGKSQPENPAIAFDKACALAAAGKRDEARDLFLDAALSRDPQLSADAHYNLGCMAAELGESELGDDPAAAVADQREKGIEQLLKAVGHYRDALRQNSAHRDARHNLELIRTFIKHIQAEWERRDRERERAEKNLLQFLAWIEAQQQSQRLSAQELADEAASPLRTQTVRELVDEQRKLAKEIDPLKQKIAEEFTSASQPGGQPDEQSQQVQQLLETLADDAGRQMLLAADSLDADDFETTTATQRDVLDQLNQIYLAVAPFQELLKRAIGEEESLVGISEEAVKPNEVDQSTGSANEESSEAPDFGQTAWQQSRVTDWTRMLTLKAQAMLPKLESQLDKLAPGEDQSAAPNQGAPDADAAQMQQQMAQLQQSLQKAVELGPQAEEHSASAAQLLEKTEVMSALPEQQETLRLLKEIAESLPEQDQQQDQSDQNQDDQQQNDQDEKSDESSDSNQDEQQQQDQQSEQDTAGEQQTEQRQQSKKEQQQSAEERAMSILRRAQEREREHRERMKQLQMLLGKRIKVEKDW